MANETWECKQTHASPAGACELSKPSNVFTCENIFEFSNVVIKTLYGTEMMTKKSIS